MWRPRRTASETAPSTVTTTAAPSAVRQQHSAPPDDSSSAYVPYEVHRIADGGGGGSTANYRQQQLASPSLSTASNVSTPALDSPARKRKQLAISNAFFGPSSQATDIFFETDHEDLDASLHEYYEHSDSDNRDSSSSRDNGIVPCHTNSSKHRKLDSRLDSCNAQPAADQSTRTRSTSFDCVDFAPVATTDRAADAASKRRRRKENQEKFKRIARLTDAQRPVSLSAFTRKASRRQRRSVSCTSHSEQPEVCQSHPHEREPSAADRMLNTELLEAYVAYARSIGREPQIDIAPSTVESESDTEGAAVVAGRASFMQPRVPVVPEPSPHVWTQYIGTRHSKRRGCVQFWAWLLLGVVVSVIMAFFLAHLSLNEVLHLDAFVEENVVVTNDFVFLHLRDEVTFRIKYEVEAEPNALNASVNAFQVLLLYEDDFEDYVEGKRFKYIHAGSTLRTTYANLPLTLIDNVEDDDVFFVVQPCTLARNPGVDYCQTKQLPTPLRGGRKVFKLKDRAYATAAAKSAASSLAIRRLYVNPMPNTCSASGWKGGSYLLLFLPFVALSLFGLRVPQMLYRRESFRANLERKYKSEFAVPENEVDYWQPMPWDRKVPKTRLLGPCCWRKMRKPFEPFYTWWRHENYFTWIFCPYRNERLARGERALIVFCSLYLTFYVLFVLVMLRDRLGANLTLAASMLIYYVLIMILPSLGKAIFKEIFKLIFRQRRKYFRVTAAAAKRTTKRDSLGGVDNIVDNHKPDTVENVDNAAASFSFRLAFCLQVLVTLCIALTQVPMFYIWMYRSCTFLKQFMYFGLLAAVTRLSLLGVVQDYVWYVVIKTWGWRDLCPYCTERLVHCDCFNDELLVLSLERVGPKWELILLLDSVLAKQPGYTAQFDQYTPEQLRERWDIVVARAQVHMDKVEKLRAFEAKKRQDRLRRRRRRRESFATAATFLGFGNRSDAAADNGADAETDSAKHRAGDAGDDSSSASHTDDDGDRASDDVDARVLQGVGCCLREQKVLALARKIALDKFEKHYDSTIVDVFHSIQAALSRRRRRTSAEAATDRDGVADDGDGAIDGRRRNIDRLSTATNDTTTDASNSSGSQSSGDTMYVLDDPQQRLARREREQLRRKRAFRVLDNYFIESVEPARDAHGHVHYVSTERDATRTQSSRGDSIAPAAGSVPSQSAPRSLLRRTDSKYAKLLLLARQKSEPRDDDVVVVVHDDRVEHAAAAFSPLAITCVDDNNVGDSESEHESALRRASADSQTSMLSMLSVADSAYAQAPSSRTFAVMERKPSLLRKVSTSASSFASWVFKIDPNDSSRA